MNSKPYPHCIEGCPFAGINKCRYNEMHTPTVAIDFDRVLFTHDHWQGHEHYGTVIEGARESIIELKEMGFKIMIWTTRGQRDIIQKALEENDIPFDYINHNPNQPPEINPSKPVADYYIDDRAIRFTNWQSAMSEIKTREKIDGYYRTPQDEKTGNIKKIKPSNSRNFVIGIGFAIIGSLLWYLILTANPDYVTSAILLTISFCFYYCSSYLILESFRRND